MEEIHMWGIIVSLISGVLMSVQGVFNSEATRQTSVWVAAAFVQATAFIVCMAAWFCTGRESSFGGLLQVQPRYVLLGGAIGAFITYTVIVAMNQLGPARSVMLIVSAQLISAWLVELFGWFGVEKVEFAWSKLLGILLMLAGIFIFKNK